MGRWKTRGEVPDKLVISLYKRNKLVDTLEPEFDDTDKTSTLSWTVPKGDQHIKVGKAYRIQVRALDSGTSQIKDFSEYFRIRCPKGGCPKKKAKPTAEVAAADLAIESINSTGTATKAGVVAAAA